MLNELLNNGLYESVNILFKLKTEKTLDEILIQGLALIKKELYSDAISTVDEVIPAVIEQSQQQILYEILITSYIKLGLKEKLSIILESEVFINCPKTVKLNILAADGYMLIMPKPKSDHPALPFLLELYHTFPFSIDIIQKLINIGFRDFNTEQLNTVPFLLSYVTGLMYMEDRRYDEALKEFTKIKEENPNCVPVLSKICICAGFLQNTIAFDDAAKGIPYTDPEVIDLRAERLATLLKKDELEQLVIQALNHNPNAPQNWLAFSYISEMRCDIGRALHIVSHAIRLDKSFGRSYYRQGSLRFAKNDNQRKALESFMKAHEIRPELETFSAIVHCEIALRHWEEASTMAQAAIQMFDKPDTPANIMAFTLLGLAQKGINMDKSIEILTNVLEKDHDNVEALGELVNIKIENNDFEAAIKILEDHQTPNNEFFFNFKMAFVYGNMKEYEKALTYIQKACSIRPTHANAREMLKHLERVLAGGEEGDGFSD